MPEDGDKDTMYALRTSFECRSTRGMCLPKYCQEDGDTMSFSAEVVD